MRKLLLIITAPLELQSGSLVVYYNSFVVHQRVSVFVQKLTSGSA